MNWLKNILTKLAQQGSINYLLKSNPSLFKEYQEKKKDIVIPSQYTGEAGEILKKWIFYRSKQGESVNLSGFDVILINPADKARTWFTKPDFTFFDLQKKNEEYHEKLKQTKNRTYISKYPITILKQYVNGLAWGRLGTGYCDSYGKSLGHCGNVNGLYDNTQRIYTFYDTTTNIHYLTFIYHQDGILGEAKAYGNSKPPIDKIRILNREDLQSVDAQEVYKDLLLLKDKDQYIWNSIRGAGYKPENNFGFQDLNEKNKEEVKKERENIDDYFSFREGKDSKNVYFIEDDEVYLNKNITKEQLKDEILNRDSQILFSYKTYDYIFKFNLQNDEDVLKIIAEDTRYSFKFAGYLKFDIAKIPKQIITSISRSSNSSYEFAIKLNFDLNKIPKEIINSISKKTELSYAYAKESNLDFNKIPKEIIEGIANDPDYSFSIAKELKFDLNKMPKEIIGGISNSPYTSFDFINHLDFNIDKIPKQIIIGVSDNPNYSFRIVEKLKFDLNKIPKEIIKGIARDPSICVSFVSELHYDFNKIPVIIIDGILSDIYSCYMLLSSTNFDLNKTPKKIIEAIMSDEYYFDIMMNKLKTIYRNKEIPKWIKYKPEKDNELA